MLSHYTTVFFVVVVFCCFFFCFFFFVSCFFLLFFFLFVCLEVLRQSQSNWVMTSMVNLPNHTFTGQALSSKLQYCAHSLARN